jgi:hypothetical protein
MNIESFCSVFSVSPSLTWLVDVCTSW